MAASPSRRKIVPQTGALERLDWDRDGGDWPNREASRFVTAGGLRWHVQELGQRCAAAAAARFGCGNPFLA